MTPLVPTLDHVVINTRDRMDEAAPLYRRLGFQLTPRGRHTLGSINHLAIFGTDYLELVGLEPGATGGRTDLLGFDIGLNGLVFASEDADATRSALVAAAVPCGDAGRFSRPVELPDGSSRDAAFAVVRLTPEAAAYGRVYFCQHLTRDLVWRDDWRRHPNGALAVERFVIAAGDPDAAARLYRTMFGADAVRPITGGYRLAAGLAAVELLSPAAVAAQLGAAAPPAGGPDRMVALTIRTLSLARAGAALQAGGVAPVAAGGRLLVGPADAFGAAIEFTEATSR